MIIQTCGTPPRTDVGAAPPLRRPASDRQPCRLGRHRPPLLFGDPASRRGPTSPTEPSSLGGNPRIAPITCSAAGVGASAVRARPTVPSFDDASARWRSRRQPDARCRSAWSKVLRPSAAEPGTNRVRELGVMARSSPYCRCAARGSREQRCCAEQDQCTLDDEAEDAERLAPVAPVVGVAGQARPSREHVADQRPQAAAGGDQEPREGHSRERYRRT
jgi:hypothetical protein